MTNTMNLPQYLKENGLFCLWRYEQNPSRPKPSKVPYNPNDTRRRGGSNDPAKFADLATAESVSEGFDGLGVGMFGDLAGIDIDDCIADGELSEMAADIVLTMDSYTEVSPSGKGVRILFRAPETVYDRSAYYLKNDEIGLEIYLAGMTNRYLTVTGEVIRGGDVEDRSERLQTVLDRYMRKKKQEPADYKPAGAPLELEDGEIIDRAMNAGNGGAFARLWYGDTAGYKSHSNADAAFCQMLAFWTDRDAQRMDSIFRQSGLYREKWDELRGEETYGQMTIRKAIERQAEGYRPPQERAQAPQPSKTVDYGQTYRYDENNPSETPVAPRRNSVQLFDDFLRKVETEDYRPLETGMRAFDNLLGGGITRQSLVMLSAAPGSGKTTLAQQIFETMARNGNDVVFLNLEMSREFLLARSVSRMLHATGYDMSASDVLRGYAWSEDQRAHVMEAANRYRAEIAPHMSYNPHGDTTDIQRIRATLESLGAQAIDEGKPAPVCVLDYLHLMTGDRLDAQEAVKKSVQMLKEYAINYGTFVFAIAANNRTSNKSGVVSQDSGRDSSAIEYTADYQLSLNFTELALHELKPDGKNHYRADDPNDMELLLRKNQRRMVVQVLKNRMNKPGGKLKLQFDARHSTFVPEAEGDY